MADNIFSKTPWTLGSERVYDAEKEDYERQQRHKANQLAKLGQLLEMADKRLSIQKMRETFEADVAIARNKADRSKVLADKAKIDANLAKETFDNKLSQAQSEDDKAHWDAKVAEIDAKRRNELIDSEIYENKHKGKGTSGGGKGDPAFKGPVRTYEDVVRLYGTNSGQATNIINMSKARMTELQAEFDVNHARRDTYASINAVMASKNTGPHYLAGLQRAAGGILNSLGFEDLAEGALKASGQDALASLFNRDIAIRILTEGRAMSNEDADKILRSMPHITQTVEGMKTLMKVYDAIGKQQFRKEEWMQEKTLVSRNSPERVLAQQAEYEFNQLYGTDFVPIGTITTDRGRKELVTFDDHLRIERKNAPNKPLPEIIDLWKDIYMQR